MGDSPFRGILYVMDSLRFDRLGCNGYDKTVTPNMDRLAAEGLNCTQAFSQAIWTYPSSGSIFTGLYPETHGSQQFAQGLDAAQPHIADAFGATDVKTACFSTTLGVSPERGFDQSFDEFYHLGDEDAGLRPDIMDVLTDRLVSWVDDHSDEGFFIVVWAMGTHHPFLTPEDDVVKDPSRPLKNVDRIPGTQDAMRRRSQAEREVVEERYDAAVEYTDRRLGDLVKVLREADIYDETALFVTADHGELFDEHARFEHASRPVQGLVEALTSRKKRTYYSVFDRSAFVGHQAVYPYDELLHVPLILKPHAEMASPMDSYDGIVELIDVLPTVYDAAGLDVPSAVQGTSIWRQLAGDTKMYTYSASQIHGGNLLYQSIRNQEYKFCTKRLVEFGVGEFFDGRSLQSVLAYFLGGRETLLTLPEESPTTDSGVRAMLATALSQHIAECAAASKSSEMTRSNIDIDEQTAEHLENLGYK